MFHVLRAGGFNVATRNHAEAILAGDFPEVVDGLVGALLQFRIGSRELIRSGGGQAASTMRLRDALYLKCFIKHDFKIQTIVDVMPRERQ